MTTLLDLWHSIIGIFTAGDSVTLVIMAAIALVTGYLMETFGSIVTSTFAALVLFALATYVRGVAVTGGKDAETLARTDWHYLLGLSVHHLLAYAITFAIVIAAVHLVRSRVGH